MTTDRRRARIAVDPALLVELLRRAGLRGAPSELRPLTDGACNTNLVFSLGSRRLVLRVGTRGQAAARAEQAALADAPPAVPVARPLHASLDGGPDDLPWALLPWIDGGPLDPDDHASARQLGRAVAAMTARRYPGEGPLVAPGRIEPWPFADGWRGFMRSRLPCVAERGGADLARAIEAALPDVEPVGGPATLVHGDLRPSNLRVRGGQLRAILDWEFAHAGDPAGDHGHAVRHLTPRALAAWAEGHRELRPLPDGWQRRARLIDSSALVEFLTADDTSPERQTRAARRLRAELSELGYGPG